MSIRPKAGRKLSEVEEMFNMYPDAHGIAALFSLAAKTTVVEEEPPLSCNYDESFDSTFDFKMYFDGLVKDGLKKERKLLTSTETPASSAVTSVDQREQIKTIEQETEIMFISDSKQTGDGKTQKKKKSVQFKEHSPVKENAANGPTLDIHVNGDTSDTNKQTRDTVVLDEEEEEVTVIKQLKTPPKDLTVANAKKPKRTAGETRDQSKVIASKSTSKCTKPTNPTKSKPSTSSPKTSTASKPGLLHFMSNVDPSVRKFTEDYAEVMRQRLAIDNTAVLNRARTRTTKKNK